MAEKPTPVYDESKIKTLSSLEHIRLRTGLRCFEPEEHISSRGGQRDLIL